MNKLISLLALFLVCYGSLAQKITTDYDQSVDFSKYKTFKFLGWQDDSDKIMNDLDKGRMRDAFQAEFKNRSIAQVDNEIPDMMVVLFLVVNQKTSTTAYTNYYGGAGRGGYRRGAGGWGGGHSTTNYSESDYLEGTLVMDVYDAQNQKLIWQGVATGTLKENPKKREKSIPKAVSKLMKKFPIQGT